MTDIHIILTGGTIDSLYNPVTETAEPVSVSCIPEYIQGVVRTYGDITFETICMLDSGDITDETRARLLESIQKTTAKRIVVIHGTNTMTRTQDFLAGKAHDKTVVLTGAMIPLKQFAMSDGGFNLGYALAEARHLPAGVYLCMHARTFHAGQVQKNFEAARFESLQVESPQDKP